MSPHGISRFGITFLLAAITLITSRSVFGADPPTPRDPVQGAHDLAARIDRHVASRWEAEGIKPAARTGDGEFIRRVYLDLAGRIPSILEVRDFLDDDRPDKRRIWVEKLLAADTYSNHFANVWRGWLLEQAPSEQVPYLAPLLANWLRDQLRKNVPYDQLARDILDAPMNQNGVGPSIFLQANELKPENLAASTSRLFLGVRLECAQCHNHPFGRWAREQFWEYAAFFAGINPQGNSTPMRGEIAIPGTDKVIAARFLDGTALNWKTSTSTRTILADWVTARDNPYFARALANRLWAYFFGTGLVEPVDDASDQNPPSHPELLEDLARQFADHQFDLKFLIRAIVASQAYQLTSASRDPSHEDVRLFARMAVRGLSPEQLFDSLAEAIEYREPAGANPYVQEGMPLSPRAEFLSKFAGRERRTETTTSILQALTMMNGKLVTDATSLQRSPTLSVIAESRGISTARRIETLFLVTLSRPPRPEESERLVKYVDSGGATGNPKEALTDVFWVLLNSGEFMLNH